MQRQFVVVTKYGRFSVFAEAWEIDDDGMLSLGPLDADFTSSADLDACFPAGEWIGIIRDDRE